MQIAISFLFYLAATLATATAATIPPELLVAAKHLAEAKTYRVVMSPVSGSLTVDVERPDRVHAHANVEPPYDVVVIGSNVWMQPASQPWRRLSPAAATTFGTFAHIGLPPDAQVTGPSEGFDGTAAAHVYTVRGSGPDPALQWFIRVSDGRLHRLSGPGKPAGSTMTMDIENYDEPLDIEAPAP